MSFVICAKWRCLWINRYVCQSGTQSFLTPIAHRTDVLYLGCQLRAQSPTGRTNSGTGLVRTHKLATGIFFFSIKLGLTDPVFIWNRRLLHVNIFNRVQQPRILLILHKVY